MITDEQRKAFEAWFKESRSSGYMPITKLGSYYLAEHESAWKAWQAAQQIKPLEFVQIDKTTKKADTVFGPYFICAYIHETRFSFPEDKYYERKCETEAEAVEAANQDYQRRVLSCLVHGGV